MSFAHASQTDSFFKQAADWLRLVSHSVNDISDGKQTMLIELSVSTYLSDTSISIARLISSSQTTKGRLLNYYPPSSDTEAQTDNEPIDNWCGFHLDHSLFTGLCSVRVNPESMLYASYCTQAMYLSADERGLPSIVPPPSANSGLYIRDRGGKLTKVSIPKDCLAFQTGEALELVTGGRLRATPHCVRVGSSPQASAVSRSTFALFMQCVKSCIPPTVNDRLWKT